MLPCGSRVRYARPTSAPSNRWVCAREGLRMGNLFFQGFTSVRKNTRILRKTKRGRRGGPPSIPRGRAPFLAVRGRCAFTFPSPSPSSPLPSVSLFLSLAPVLFSRPLHLFLSFFNPVSVPLHFPARVVYRRAASTPPSRPRVRSPPWPCPMACLTS